VRPSAGPTVRRTLLILTCLVTGVSLAGCGGGSAKPASGAAGSGAARRLLVQTFDGRHAIRSGVIKFELKVTPRGSDSIRTPIDLSFGGPFKSSGAHRPPQSDFTIAISAQGHSGALQLISARGRAYVTVAGQSFRIPDSSYRRLASGFGSLAASGAGRGSRAGALSKLGINPLHWLAHPRIVGRAEVGGVATTRIRAGLDAGAMLGDLSTLLARAGSLGGSGAGSPGLSGAGSLGLSGAGSLTHGVPPAAQRSIAGALRSARVSVWTGRRDRLLRRLTVVARVRVTGQTRRLLGAVRSAAVKFSFQYSHVNQPQTITVPAETAPYSVFRAEVTNILDEVAGGALGNPLGAGAGRAGSSGGAALAQRYTRCIIAARAEVSKMQKCAKLLAAG
jgi:hypothetical protein